MLDTIVVDDEIHALERLKELVAEVNSLNLIADYKKASNCLEDIKEVEVDVLLLDIEMPGYTGLELARKLFEIDESIDIIFVTAYDSYAVEAFELNVLDYLLKPITEERFQQTIDRLLDEEEKAIETRDLALKVLTLGEFELLYKEEELDIDWPTAKTKELFLYLLYHRGDFVSRDKIITALWNERDPQKAADILYTTVYSLRKIFKRVGVEDIVKSKRGFYGIDLEKIEWDIFEFERIADEIKYDVDDKIDRVDKVLELYRGEFLEQENYGWVYDMQVDMKRMLKKVLFKAANYYGERRDYEEEQRILHRIIEETFLSERAYKRLIELYKKMGNKAAAKELYEELREKLQDEFGVEPGIEL